MTNFGLFPFGVEPLEIATDAFLVDVSPTAALYATVGANTVSIFGCQTPGGSVIYERCRDKEDVKEHGPNHWFVWITDDAFAFGTCTGHTVIVGSLALGDAMSVVVSTIGVTSAAFSVYGMLALCTSGPKIVYVDVRGAVVVVMPVDAPFPLIKRPSVHDGSFLTCFVNNMVYTAHVSKASISARWGLALKPFPVVNVAMAAVDERGSRLAVGLCDGTVIVTELHFSQESERRVVVEAGGEVALMFWIESSGQLCIVKDGGLVIMWSLCCGHCYKVNVPTLAGMKSGSFDEHTKVLLTINGQSLLSVGFCGVTPPLCVTARTVFSLATGVKVATIENCPQFGTVISLPSEMYPIELSVESCRGDICLFGGQRIAVLAKNEMFVERLENVTQVTWLGSKLCVFTSKGTSHSIRMFSRDLKRFRTLASPHRVDQIPSSHDGKIVVAYKNHFTVFEFGDELMEKPDGIAHVTYSMDMDDVSVTITTLTIRHNILDVICGVANDVLIHVRGGDLISCPSMLVIEHNVSRIWRNQRSDLVFVECDGRIFVHDGTTVREFDQVLCSCGPDFITLRDGHKFEEFPFTATDFALQTLERQLRDTRICVVFAQTLVNLAQFDRLMNSLCIFAIQNGALGSFIDLLNELDIDLRSHIVCHLEAGLQKKLAASNFDISTLFEHVSEPLQAEILKSADPRTLISLLPQHRSIIANFSSAMNNNIVDSAVDDGQWSQAMRFCEVFHLDLVPRLKTRQFLSYSDFGQCYSVLLRESELWDDDHEREILKMLAFSFILGDLPLWAMACLVLTNDISKAVFLVTSDDSLRSTLCDFTSHHPLAAPTIFLTKVL